MKWGMIEEQRGEGRSGIQYLSIQAWRRFSEIQQMSCKSCFVFQPCLLLLHNPWVCFSVIQQREDFACLIIRQVPTEPTVYLSLLYYHVHENEWRPQLAAYYGGEGVGRGCRKILWKHWRIEAFVDFSILRECNNYIEGREIIFRQRTKRAFWEANCKIIIWSISDYYLLKL